MAQTPLLVAGTRSTHIARGGPLQRSEKGEPTWTATTPRLRTLMDTIDCGRLSLSGLPLGALRRKRRGRAHPCGNLWRGDIFWSGFSRNAGRHASVPQFLGIARRCRECARIRGHSLSNRTIDGTSLGIAVADYVMENALCQTGRVKLDGHHGGAAEIGLSCGLDTIKAGRSSGRRMTRPRSTRIPVGFSVQFFAAVGFLISSPLASGLHDLQPEPPPSPSAAGA